MFLNPSTAKRILFCTKGNCADPDDARALLAHVETLIAAHGLDNPAHPNHTVCAAVNCLGVCHSGPVVMIHPGAIRYGSVTPAMLNEIFVSHILNDTPVQKWVLPYPQKRKV